MIACLSCEPSRKPQAIQAIQQVHKTDPKCYFIYDEIVAYRTNISEHDLDMVPPKTSLDSLRNDVLSFGVPASVHDTSFIAKLGSMGFSKKDIDPSKFSAISAIFREKKSLEHSASACIHVYRDVLVFKQLSKTIGIAKICFGCHAYKIRGTKANTDDFGQDGDYARLQSLLN